MFDSQRTSLYRAANFHLLNVRGGHIPCSDNRKYLFEPGNWEESFGQVLWCGQVKYFIHFLDVTIEMHSLLLLFLLLLFVVVVVCCFYDYWCLTQFVVVYKHRGYMSSSLEKKGYKPDVKLEYNDESGRAMSQKEVSEQSKTCLHCFS